MEKAKGMREPLTEENQKRLDEYMRTFDWDEHAKNMDKLFKDLAVKGETEFKSKQIIMNEEQEIVMSTDREKEVFLDDLMYHVQEHTLVDFDLRITKELEGHYSIHGSGNYVLADQDFVDVLTKEITKGYKKV